MAYPIKINWKTEIMPVVMLAVAVILAGYFYTHFPDRVAGHWNFAGQVDRYTGKAEGVWAIPVLLIAIYGLFLGLPVLDPKRERYADFQKEYLIFRNLIMGLLLFVYTGMGLFNLGYGVNVGKFTAGAVGVMLVVMGKFMGKLKQNWFVGIKTPWTLSSEKVWNKTHRVGGWMFVIFGLTVMAAPWLPENVGMILFMGGAIMATVGSFGYSYLVYRQENR
jgi:uncharacterized membrane protein